MIIKKLFLFVLIFLGCIASVTAQDLLRGNDLSRVSIDNVSEADILKFQQQLAASGMSQAQAEQMAASKGMPQSEIAKLRDRLSRLQSNSNGTANRGGDSSKTQSSTNVTRQVAPIDFKTYNNPPPSNLFGSQLFTTPSLSFEPNLRIATPINYVLGPDDELQVSMFGYQEANYKLQILPEGSVIIPQVGTVFLSGLTIEAATKKITDKLAATRYPTLRTGQSSISITLNKIRSIHVTIIGANKAGNFLVSSLTTVFNALYLCGGPDNNLGTYRKIELIRNGKLYKKIDLYEFLIKGDTKGNVLLQEGDVINIPVYSIRVKINGEVKRAGVYEMLDNESINELITYAGGFTEKAYTASIKIKQVTEKEHRIKDLQKQAYANYFLQKGDEVDVSAILDRLENGVTITGAVYRPGQFELTKGLKLSELIKKADGLKPDVYLARGLLTRTYEDQTKEAISFQLSEVVGGKNDIVLQREDVITIASINDFKEAKQVSITGAVRKPGSFPFQEHITLRDVLFLAGGVKEDVLVDRATITRTHADLTKEIIPFQLTDYLIIGGTKDIALQKEDVVSIGSINEFKEVQQITISGEVRKPGTLPYQQNMTLKDVLFLSGGLTEAASSYKIEIGRRIKNNNQISDTIATVLEVNTDAGFAITGDNFLLQPFDEITVRKNPGYVVQKQVTITGEILYPGAYTLQTKKDRISDLLKKAGGFTPTAFAEGVSLIRKNNNGSGVQSTKKDVAQNVQKSLKDSSSNVLQDVASATVRIAINAQYVLDNPGSKEDLILEEGDEINVAKFESLVKMSGEVFSPTKTEFIQGRTVRFYLGKAGGVSDNARKAKMYVLYANGGLKRTHTAIFGLVRNYPKVKPGSEIIVPKKPEAKPKTTGEIVGLTSVIVSLAGLVITIIKNL